MKKIIFIKTSILLILGIFFFTDCASTSGRRSGAVKNGIVNNKEKFGIKNNEIEKDISQKIVDAVIANISKVRNKRVAVINFSDLNGKETEEGKLLSEQITTKLSLNKDISVIERGHLNKIIEEQKLNMAGFTTDTDQELGTILNVDAIISGTITRLDDYDEVNARLIDVKTGEIYCAVSVKGHIEIISKIRDKIPPDNKHLRPPIELRQRELPEHKSPPFNSIKGYEKALFRLRENRPKIYKNTIKAIEILERLKRENPRFFLLATEPSHSPKIKRLARRISVEQKHRLKKLRRRLKFILDQFPIYREKLIKDRQHLLRKSKVLNKLR